MNTDCWLIPVLKLGTCFFNISSYTVVLILPCGLYPLQKSYQTHHTMSSKFHRLFGGVGRVSANGPGDLGSIPGCVIPKTSKMVVDTFLLNTPQYKVRIKGKVEPSRKGVAPSPTPRCSSYWNENHLVSLVYGRQLNFSRLRRISFVRTVSNEPSFTTEQVKFWLIAEMNRILMFFSPYHLFSGKFQ